MDALEEVTELAAPLGGAAGSVPSSAADDSSETSKRRQIDSECRWPTGAPAPIAPCQPCGSGGGLWTQSSAPQSEAERQFHASMNARAPAQTADAQPSTASAAGVLPGGSVSAAGVPSGGDTRDGANPRSPNPAQPDYDYYLWNVSRDNIQAYVKKDKTSEVIVERVAHRGQMIIGGSQDRDGWVSI